MMMPNNNQESSGLAIGADLWISLKLSTTVDYTANEELQVKHESARNQGARPEEACATRPIPAATVVPTSRTYHSKAPPPPFLHALAWSHTIWELPLLSPQRKETKTIGTL